MPVLTIDEFNQESGHVKITVTEGIVNELKSAITSMDAPTDGWASHVPARLATADERINYLSMVVAIDYRHWGCASPVTPGNKVIKKDFFAEIEAIGKCRGSQAMVEMLKRAGTQGVNWHTPEWILEESSEEKLRQILTGVDADGVKMEIPDFDSRFHILKDIASYLRRNNTNFAAEFRSCQGRIWGNGGAMDFLQKLHSRYNDVGTFNGRNVSLMKLAQLTVIAVTSVAPEMFSDSELSKLTICPDYQVPKALRHLGALSYSQELSEMIANHVLLEPNGVHEVEVRLASVIAAGSIQKRLNVTTSTLDYVLWKLGRESAQPHHLCMTNMY